MQTLGVGPTQGGPDRRRPLLVAVALVLALAAGGAAYLVLLLRQPEATKTAGGARPAPTPTAAEAGRSRTGTLEVGSRASGAVVSVDGRVVGIAPQSVELPAGPHRLRVTSEGLQPFEREVQILPGHAVRITAALENEPPLLRVDADVPGANVFLDRKFLGTTPLETREAAPGPHRLNVSADGYDMYAETIDLTSGTREVTVRFKEVRLDESLPVVHRHGIGSCRGTLVATNAGLRYETDRTADSFAAPFTALAPLQVDYLHRNLRVSLAGGRSYNFTADSADALLAFQKAVEAARKRL